MDIAKLKNPKELTLREKSKITKAVKKTVSQYKLTLELLAKS